METTLTDTIARSPSSSTIAVEQYLSPLRDAYLRHGAPSQNARVDALRRLHRTLGRHESRLEATLERDLLRPPHETQLVEFVPVYTELRHAIAATKSWMRRRSVSTPMTLFGTRSYIQPEPKGVVLILGAWNYPIALTLIPLISAVSAGNRVLLKPSEHAPATASALKDLLAEVFAPNEVCVVEGGADVAAALCASAVDHIFFTGGPEIGKKVMQAASQRLTSVTLELGGKSPVVFEAGAVRSDTVQKLVWGKMMNSGQTCIAPDYVLCHEDDRDELVDLIEVELRYRYRSPEYQQTAIVNARHEQRLMETIEECRQAGCKVIVRSDGPSEPRRLPLTLIINPQDHLRVMQEEVFGPILPIRTYRSEETIFETIGARPKPLTSYVFARTSSFKSRLERLLSAGGMVFNDVLVQYSNTHLPFGGAGYSGHGRSHGKAGFDSFSNLKSVLVQPTRRSALTLLYPPYASRGRRLLSLVLSTLRRTG